MDNSRLGLGPVLRRELEWGVAMAPLPGEVTSGDLHVVREFPGGVLVAVIDALGHGPHAAQAAGLAAATLEQHAHESPRELLQRCDRALVGTRGAVISLASITWSDNLLTWSGVGDVTGVLLVADDQATARKSVLLTRGGIVGTGDQPAARPSVRPLAPGDVLVLATDGVQPEFALGAALAPHPPQQMAHDILRRFQKGTDDALVLVARYPDTEPAP